MASLDNLASFSAVLAKLPQQRIAQTISVLLLIYIAFIAAKTTWLLVPQKSTVGNAANSNYVAKKNSSGQSVNISAVQSLHLFGQYQAQAQVEVVEQITSAPETRLQLTLSGLVASDNPDIAAAIIEHQGKQATYGVGDIIKGTRANLERVLIDRVIIKQSGRLETLMLDGADYNQPVQTFSSKQATNTAAQSKNKAKQGQPTTVDQRTNANLSASAQSLRADLANDPSKITDYLNISPASKNGAIVGYRLSPGKNPEFFKLSGLKSGDVAVQMNGFNLLEPMEAAQAMSALKTERDISLLVQRADNLIEILFSIE